MKTKQNLLILLGVTLIFTGCAKEEEPPASPAAEEHKAITAETLAPFECGDIERLHTFEGIFLASQPSPADFEQAQKNGVKTVINLRHSTEVKDFDEEKVVTDLGLTYHNPAWNGEEELTDEVFDQVLDLLRSEERVILFHCSSANRVGAIWVAYRALDGGLDVEEAVGEAKTVGMKSPAYEQKARDYVSRKVSAES